MKRLILLSLAYSLSLIASLQLSAQNARPDTVYWGDSCYLFLPHPEHFVHNMVSENEDSLTVFSTTIAWSNVVESRIFNIGHTETLVHGIAVPMDRSKTEPLITDFTEAHRFCPRAYLFQCENRRWHTVDSVGLSEYIPSRFFSTSVTFQGQTVSQTTKVYEFFFSQPHLVHDTFAVGFGYDYGHRQFNEGYLGQTGSIQERLYCYFSNNPPSFLLYKTYISSSQTRRPPFFEVHDVELDDLTIALPILEEAPEDYVFFAVEDDTTPIPFPCLFCNTVPREIRVAFIIGNDVTLQWFKDYDAPTFWQLEVESVTRPDEHIRLFDTQFSQHCIESLDSGLYIARVRGACRHTCDIHEDTVTYSPWFESFFSVDHPIAHDSNLSVDDVPQATLLVAPNPAEDFVEVIASCHILSVSLQNLWGQTLFFKNADESSLRISTATLPRGLYILKATTEHGLFSEKVLLR